MEQIQLDVQARQQAGSARAKALRDKGYIPGVVYGGAKKPVPVQILRKDFDRVMRHHEGESILFHVVVSDNGKKAEDFTALLKETQYHPVNDTVEHLDFLRVSMDKEISVRIPIITRGEAIGLKKPGATLETLMREIELICLPKDIPHHIEVDVTNLDTHHAIHVRELTLPAGVRTKVDPEAVVVAMVFATREEVAAPAAGEEAAKAEPEVIKEKPKEEKAAAEGGAKAAGGKAEGAAKPAAGKAEGGPKK